MSQLGIVDSIDRWIPNPLPDGIFLAKNSSYDEMPAQNPLCTYVQFFRL